MKKFDMDYNHELAKKRKEETAQWNAIYRSALRLVPENKRAEVERRRAQGRLTRNLFIPVVIGTGILAHSIHPLLTLVTIPTAIVFVTYLYAYAELNNMSEAHDIASLSSEAPSHTSRDDDPKS
jgi:hypothetical protein